MKLRLRIILAALCVIALAAPVIATATRFSDVPADHEHAEAIRWASELDEPLFRGYPDGSFKPDRQLSENEFQIVVERLFRHFDSWTRAQTAALLYHGFQGLSGSATTTTTTVPTTTTMAAGEEVAATGPEVWNRYRAAACSDWTSTDGWSVARLRMMVADADAFGYDWGRRWDDDGDGFPCEELLGGGYPLIRGIPLEVEVWDHLRALPCDLWTRQVFGGSSSEELESLRGTARSARDIGYDWGAGLDPDGDGEPCEDLLGGDYLGRYYPYAVPAYRRPG